MDKFVKLGQDMVLLWSKYKVMYWAGIWNTLKLAFLATLIGCFIGLLCGVLNTIPYTKEDQAVPAEAAADHHPHLCRGVPGDPHGAAIRVHLLRPALLLQ